MTLNTYIDPYGRRYNAKIKRRKFESFKKTKQFKNWKIKQIQIQKNRCAWCKVLLNKRIIITHIDHITPLYYDGSNDLNNLVLSCSRCNMRKWVSNKYVKPQWIKDREKHLELKEMRKEQELIAIQVLDENLLDRINQWV